MNKRFDTSQPTPLAPPRSMHNLPPGVSVERHTPVHAPTVTGQVWVPFLRAILSGVWTLFLAVIVTKAEGWPWWVPLIVFIATGAVVWFCKGLSDSLLYVTEKVTGRDIDQDGHIGPPSINITVEEPFTNNLRRLPGVPCTPEQLKAFSEGVTYEGKTLSLGQWCGRGKPFRRGEYEEFIADLHARGIIVWKDKKNTNLGREFTVYGRGVFRQVAEQMRAGMHEHVGGTIQALPEPGAGEWEDD